jgi:hypothetical protein
MRNQFQNQPRSGPASLHPHPTSSSRDCGRSMGVPLASHPSYLGSSETGSKSLESQSSKIISAWLILLFSLSLYSYSQIDLNLTLSSFGPYQVWQQRMIRLGYFQRPFSTFIFGALVISLGVCSYWLIDQVKQKSLRGRRLWVVILLGLLVILPSYPAFSHDVFNYLFSAKLVTQYHVNPYQVRPLDFSQDPWVRFMRWTHKPTAYPPFWLILTLPTTLFSFNKFTLALLLIKLLTVGFFLLAAKLIEQLGGETALALWAFNPLVVIEGVVSLHNDLAMMALVLLAVWFLRQSRKGLGIITAVLSSGTKVVGGVAALPFLVKKWPWDHQIRVAGLLMALATILISLRMGQMGFQPWYLLWPVTFAAFIDKRRTLTWILSLLALLTYLPYLYLGDWAGWPELLRSSFVAVVVLILPFWFC